MSNVARVDVDRELQLVVARDHPDPHHYLGAHQDDDGVVVRAYRPDAIAVRVLRDGEQPVVLGRIDPTSVFEGVVRGASLPLPVAPVIFPFS